MECQKPLTLLNKKGKIKNENQKICDITFLHKSRLHLPVTVFTILKEYTTYIHFIIGKLFSFPYVYIPNSLKYYFSIKKCLNIFIELYQNQFFKK